MKKSPRFIVQRIAHPTPAQRNASLKWEVYDKLTARVISRWSLKANANKSCNRWNKADGKS